MRNSLHLIQAFIKATSIFHSIFLTHEIERGVSLIKFVSVVFCLNLTFESTYLVVPFKPCGNFFCTFLIQYTL